MKQPEIDPELAELEAEARKNHVHAKVGKGNKTGGIHQFLAAIAAATVPKTGPTGKPISERSARRAMLRGNGEGRGAYSTPHARLGRAKPTKSQWQRDMEMRRAVRAELSRIKITRLLGEVPELKFVAGVPGLNNVWQLCRASTATIHAIPGLGPARRAKIRAYLISKNVPVTWEA